MWNRSLNLLELCLLLVVCISCSSPSSPTLFSLRTPAETGIHFSNAITENDTMNILSFEYVYNGGGVAIADFNQDSLPDIFFTGNQVPNALYLNQGNFQFKEVSEEAGITAPDQWSYGVSLVDINADNKMDIYVANTVHQPGSRRANQLFVNQGNDEAGVPIFKEEAANYGIADTGHSVMGAFFDYDRDGDLDLYVLTNEMATDRTPNVYRNQQDQGQNPNTDRLYRNEGNGNFTNVSMEAGIRYEGYGLGISIRDMNLDDLPDIYVTNDYISNDLLYINQGDGTFRNQIKDYLKHQSHSAMGHDVADINDDGLEEIIAVDMLAEFNERKKELIPGNNYMSYVNTRKFGYNYQYVRNTLQVNNGLGPLGHPTFSEVSQLSGVHATDWSWSPLLADFDHDEDRDLLITNGFPKDITDLDFSLYRQQNSRYMKLKDLEKLIPEVKIANYAFENTGDLSFSNATKTWGIQYPSFSNGAAYADLDLDGDLDYVVNNIDDSAFVFENRLETLPTTSHSLSITLKGKAPNTMALGTRISIHYGEGKRQFHTHSPYRGYISTVEPKIHFGLGVHDRIDSIQVFWPDGSYSLVTEVTSDQELEIAQESSSTLENKSWKKDALRVESALATFSQVARETGLIYLHEEQEKYDFNVQYTLPHKFTQSGPGIAVGDINNDGLDDVYIGGSSEHASRAFVQLEDGRFSPLDISGITVSKEEEDMGILLFDADQDQDLDLYLVSGSFEFPEGHSAFQDRLFFNDGKGKFEYRANVLPEIRSSGSCVRAADVDRDGDLDLFIGGRVVSGRYPETPESFLLINEGGTFTDQTPEALKSVGMVTDALWTDVDNDHWIDLMVVGEWMPITLFSNAKGSLEKESIPGLDQRIGWWNSLQSGDFDKDGDTDYIVGNLGLNTTYKGDETHPMRMLANDFDSSGSMDPLLFCYLPSKEGGTELFPMHARDDIIKQMQVMRKRYPLHEDYGKATLETLLTPEERASALSFEANYFSSSLIINEGEGVFTLKALPIEAQYAPVNGIQVADYNQDGHLDALLTGNNFSAEIFVGRYDAMEGLLLAGDGKGNFESQLPAVTGFLVNGDAKALARVHRPNLPSLYLATQNMDSLEVFTQNRTAGEAPTTYRFESLDAYALLYLGKDRVEKVEAPYGSSYLSQSSRILNIPSEVERVVIYTYKGEEKELDL